MTKTKKPDMAKLKAQYAAYRKTMAKSPDTVMNTKTFKDWMMDQDVDLNDTD